MRPPSRLSRTAEILARQFDRAAAQYFHPVPAHPDEGARRPAGGGTAVENPAASLEDLVDHLRRGGGGLASAVGAGGGEGAAEAGHQRLGGGVRRLADRDAPLGEERGGDPAPG